MVACGASATFHLHDLDYIRHTSKETDGFGDTIKWSDPCGGRVAQAMGTAPARCYETPDEPAWSGITHLPLYDPFQRAQSVADEVGSELLINVTAL